jgi:DNA repair protein NreA
MENLKFEALNKISKFNIRKTNLFNSSKLDTISPPSVFVGSKLKYPFANVGIISPIEKQDEAWIFDSPKYWAKENFEISEIIRLRDNLLNSRFQARVYDARLKNKFVEIAKEIAIASKPVDLEIELKKKLNFKKNLDRVTTYQGMKGELNKAKITSNVKVETKVENVMNDEIKASHGMEILYKNRIDENAISKILSVGVLGLKNNKRMVPTRWSITATDDILSKNLLEKIRDYKIIEDYELFFGEFMGNQYLILLFPQVWSFELFELYYPGSSWNPGLEIKASRDFEFFWNRKDYASNTQGGYYATRFPITKYLEEKKRQASVLVIRLETPSYWAGLGVWVVRESVGKALSNLKKFTDKKEFLESAKKICKIKFDFDLKKIFKESKLLKKLESEKSLREWF